MTSPDDRDDAAMQRLLKRALGDQPPPGPAGDECLDAETLAAWADDELAPPARRRAEAHAAGCARCQATLAAMVRTEPLAARSSPARAWWRRPVVAWMIPVAAAAVLIAAWIVVPAGPVEREPAKTAESQIARKDAGGAAAVPQQASTPSSNAPVGTPANEPPPARSPARAKIATPAAEPPASGPRLAASPVDTLAENSVEASAKRAAPKPASEPEGQGLKASPIAGARPETVAPSSAGAAGGAIASGSADAAPRKALAAPASFVVASPDSAIRWRVSPDAIVERSIDGGLTWTRQDAGTAVRFSAGSAPSPMVCWLVGSDGAVALSTDGTTWRRVTFPERVPLVAVRAIDARSASVTTSTGMTFTTADGGVTWMPAPPK